MNFIFFRSIVLLALLLVAPPAISWAEENLVATVGGIPVTKFELSREFQKIYPLKGKFHGGASAERLNEIRSEALNYLIEQAYKVRYALDEEIAINNKVVEEKITALKSKYSSLEELDKAAGEEGVSGYRASVYRKLLAEKAEEVAVDSKVKVSEEEVRTYYEENKNKYVRPKQFKASHILIRVDPSSNDEERQVLLRRAEQLAGKAKTGEDFYNLAYYNSDDRSKYVGGDIGTFHLGQTVKEFENALLAMEPGDISDPVRTLYGYHIIKLDNVEEGRQLEFDEVKGTILQQLKEMKRNAIYREWMVQLKSKYELNRLDP